MEHFIKLYTKKKGKNTRKDNRAVQKLLRREGGIDSSVGRGLAPLPRGRGSTMKQVLDLEDADLNMNDIDEMVLEGGSTKVQQLVKDFFGGKKKKKMIDDSGVYDFIFSDGDYAGDCIEDGDDGGGGGCIDAAGGDSSDGNYAVWLY
ncbi:78 kDa glucose-regulated protein [Elysia marginata]|uniref:78 kDa glucose-regulated protein n=1 Tax=Elysia marginata TaxID=1093978 RepID=A0AAV4JWQ2_9GAST|nr:78 kDa glucose-regulated protein [Elysia marginata]